MPPIVEVVNLAVAFPEPAGGWRRVVDGVTLALNEGEAMGVVGESGCGKTLTALALLRLIPEPGRIVGGTIRIDGEDVLAAEERRVCWIRGALVGLIFQEPVQALNPVRSVASQVVEAARLHGKVSGSEVPALAARLLAEVGLEEPGRIARSYPHQLSGGQRQRVLLASALAADPRVLVADEATSALDTVSQQRMVELLQRLHESRRLSLLFVSHDLSLVGRVVDRITVLYAGETVEIADRDALLGDPKHPYTRALLETRVAIADGPNVRFPTVPGRVPKARDWGRGCRFAPRCPFAFERCREARPALTALPQGRTVRCFLMGDAEEPGA
ncbi:MAG: ABC transporter ATP-binding protein [Thermoanaerobaculaceae bacterium]|jgi:oligopeptide/dipeptide ABC transporter ATP-binding protein